MNGIEIHLGLPVTAAYTAVIKDQGGNVMASETVTWSLKTPVTGVSVDSNTGVLTVSSDPLVGSIILVATSTTDPTKSVEKLISIV